MKFKILSLILIPTFLFGMTADPEGVGLHFLMTFPRSGTNLTSCYIQALTRKPIAFLNYDGWMLASNRLNLELDYSKKTLYREHDGNWIIKFNKNNNKLLFVLRNYIESIHRHAQQMDASSFKDLFLNNDFLVQSYITNINTYDEWEKDHRILIYYEDLISNPINEIKKILFFLDEPIPQYLDEEFLKNVAERALDSYHHQHLSTGGSQSKGNDLTYHTKQLPLEYVSQINEYMKANYPILWDKYLTRYQFP